MNLAEMFDKSFSTEDDFSDPELFNEDGFFSISPIIAFYGMKEKALDSMQKGKALIAKNPMTKVGRKIKAKVSAKTEVAKAKLGITSGDDDNATVYKLTKEQKEYLGKLYNKYGKELIDKIMKFRNEVVAPYQVIKRNVQKSSKLTDAEVFGMSKEEFFRYRESGRRKIERRKNYDKNFEEQHKELTRLRIKLADAEKAYSSFKKTGNIDAAASILEKIYTELNVGDKKLNNWPLDELNKTATRIATLEKCLLQTPDENGNILVPSKTGKKANIPSSMEEVRNEIESLRVSGFSRNYSEDIIGDSGEKKGSFRDALAVYMLRKQVRDEIMDSSSNSAYRYLYDKILKDAIRNANENVNSSFDKFVNIKGTVELNDKEKKIWELRPEVTDRMSGNIEDWYQKITEKDFKGTRYIKKPQGVIDAENEINALSKKFERDLEKMIDPVEIAELKKYRLINNPITVKELKDPSSLFKTASEIRISSAERDEHQSTTEEDYFRKLKGYYETTFGSFKELEAAKDDIRDMRPTIDKDTDEKYRVATDKFLSKRGLKASRMPGYDYSDEENTAVDYDSIQEYARRIKEKEYYSIDTIENDEKEFNDMVDKYKEDNDLSDTDAGRVDNLVDKIENYLSAQRGAIEDNG